MRLSSRNYRQYLQDWRSHPLSRSQSSHSASPHRNRFVFLNDLSFFLYATAPLFLGLEFFIQFKMESLPMGFSFPFGFILFWALIYTYRNPIVGGKGRPSSEMYRSPKVDAPPAQKKKTEQIQEKPLPPEIESALSILGVKNCRDWSIIHKRYRELAKQVHPDLNPELTAAENRFIIYDHAYRKLVAVKNRYFKTKL